MAPTWVVGATVNLVRRVESETLHRRARADGIRYASMRGWCRLWGVDVDGSVLPEIKNEHSKHSGGFFFLFPVVINSPPPFLFPFFLFSVLIVFCVSVGTNLMKLGHNKSLALEEFQRNNAPASPTTTLPPPPSSSLEKDSTSKHLRSSHHPSHHHHHHRSSSNSNSKPRPARSFREWQAGIALFAGGNVFNFVSFGFAAQSLLAALGSVQFVSNVVFARLVLKEAVTWRVLGATALIVTGEFVVFSFFLFRCFEREGE